MRSSYGAILMLTSTHHHSHLLPFILTSLLQRITLHLKRLKTLLVCLKSRTSLSALREVHFVHCVLTCIVRKIWRGSVVSNRALPYVLTGSDDHNISVLLLLLLWKCELYPGQSIPATYCRPRKLHFCFVLQNECDCFYCCLYLPSVFRENERIATTPSSCHPTPFSGKHTGMLIFILCS